MELKGPLGVVFGVVVLGLWVFVTLSAVMTARHSSAKIALWFVFPAPSDSLSVEGRRWRKRYLIGVAAAFGLFGLGFLVSRP